MRFLSLALIVILAFAHPSVAQEGANKVSGLSLPADYEVSPEEISTTVTAQTKGQVKFYALGSVPLPKAPRQKGSSFVVVLPDDDCEIAVVAVALVDGKMTDFARCVITVRGAKASPNEPKNVANPRAQATPLPTVSGKVFVTIVEDQNQRTKQIADVLNSQSLKDYVGSVGALKVVDRADPWIAEKTLTGYIAGLKVPLIIVQDERGHVKDEKGQARVFPLPATDQEVIALLKKLRGE